MRLSSLRLHLVAALFFIAPCALLAQARPTPEQAAELLRNRPDLVQQLRQRIGTSGLTPDQVRARLRAEGYPENLLDAYLPGGTMAADSTPSADVFAAVRSLGIADSADVEFLQSGELHCESSVDSLLTPEDSTPLTPAERRARLLRAQRCREADRLADRERGRPLTRLARLAAQFPDSGFAIFGLDVFARSTTLFDANQGGPVDPNYRLGPGDRLVLILTGDVEAAHSLDVTREGFIVIPQVGQLYVANLTLAQLDDLLYSRLGRVYSGVRRGGGTTRFSVSVARLRSNQVYVMGDVSRPGSYRVSSAGTALSALYQAGGPTENGTLRQVEIRRGGRVVSTLDLYDYLLRGDASRDVRLETGDIVFVGPHRSWARVVGEVTRPATYELREGETMTDLLQYAGGFLPSASRSRLQVERIVPPEQRVASGRERTVIDIAADASVGTPAVPVVAGDVVRVFPVAERVRNRITVRGNVWSPGSQGFQPGMRIADALRAAGGVKPDAYLGQLLVTRLQSDSTRTQLRASLQDTTGHVLNDFPLQEDDEIRVFSVTEFRPSRFVAISGAVRKPGQYPYRRGMTLRDLVLLAGGLRESAFLNEAEVARLPEDRRNGTTARTVRVPLDSSYLFERGPDGSYFGPPGLPAASSGQSPETPLDPYDNVLILHQPDWELLRRVVISGEVRFPGPYVLVNKNERLVDVVKRAGGLTSEAYADGVTFFRQHGVGRIGIDLPRALRDPRHQDNLLLQDGDSIVVPVYNAVVTVTGAVNSPVAVSYVPGKDLAFYVRAAGGPARRADMTRSYVTQPNGKVESVERRPLLPDGVPNPRAGSVVFVPERDPADRRDLVQLAATLTQVLTGLATLTVAIISIKR
ncbi:MAG: SLBB domain-containing protein [Gemmatimonadaceae bacterium]